MNPNLQKLKLVGLDPSLRNWGVAKGTFDLHSRKLSIDAVEVICPVIHTGKQVRQNSQDIEAAQQLYAGAIAAVEGAHAVFVEVPVGAQSARSMASYAICVGVLGALRHQGHSFFTVTATEVKMASFGSKTATKKEMIGWATVKHPEASWPIHKINGNSLIVEGKAEHMADAIAAIYAGGQLPEFRQMLTLMSAFQTKENHANLSQTI